MSYQATKSQGRNLNVHFQAKEVNLRRLYTVCFYLNKFMERKIYGEGRKHQWLPGFGEREW
jgi:hypothetical protein